MKIKRSGDGSGPDPVDIHVGKRIKARRALVGISQETLALACGVTFQQVQKYESGHNRVSASRLFQIAKLLKVVPGFFFEGLIADSDADLADDPMRTDEAMTIVRLFNRLDVVAQPHFLELLRCYGSARRDAAA